MPAFIDMTVIWLVAMIILLIIEGVVPGLVSIWFALGALAALISALLCAPIWLQIVWFLLVSIISLALTRPLAKKYVNARVQHTNADAVLGRECIVTEDIDNVLGVGAVVVGGKTWTARSADDNLKIKKGETVKALRIDGVKLIVAPANVEEENI